MTKGSHHTKLARDKITLANLGRKDSEATRQKKREANLGRNFTLSVSQRERYSKSHKGLHLSEGAKEKLRSFWSLRAGLQVKPNRCELAVYNAQKELGLGYSLTVNAPDPSFGRKVPDLTHFELKKIIEVWGDYWHRGQNPQERVDYFKKLGYDTLVIWEHEIRNLDMIKTKLLDFTRGG